jgi:hypothetical protein
MKARKTRFLTTFLAFVLLLVPIISTFSSCGNRNTATFTFELKDSKLKYSEAVGVYYAEITVVTTCTSGRLEDKEYPHNVEGGHPFLYLDNGHIEGKAEFNGATSELRIRKEIPWSTRGHSTFPVTLWKANTLFAWSGSVRSRSSMK